MCVAMNDDRLEPGERCASTSNRNFEGRQGQGGRTHLMSPAMAAAAAIAGCIVDVRHFWIIMNPFTSLTSVAAPLPEGDVDTDIIFPARFLLLLNKDGLAEHLFHERRRAKGQPKFVLDTPPFDRAKILVAGENFGCGSSREQAVWAIADFGIRAILAPSFGEIFFNNCLKNGVLPIVMDRLAHTRAMKAALAEQPLTVDLEARTVSLRRWRDDPVRIGRLRPPHDFARAR